MLRFLAGRFTHGRFAFSHEDMRLWALKRATANWLAHCEGVANRRSRPELRPTGMIEKRRKLVFSILVYTGIIALVAFMLFHQSTIKQRLTDKQRLTETPFSGPNSASLFTAGAFGFLLLIRRSPPGNPHEFRPITTAQSKRDHEYWKAMGGSARRASI